MANKKAKRKTPTGQSKNHERFKQTLIDLIVNIVAGSVVLLIQRLLE